MDEPLLTVREVAERMRVTPKTVRRWIAGGIIRRASKVSARSGWLIPRSEIDRLLRESWPDRSPEVLLKKY